MIKMSYTKYGGNCSGMGQGPMGGAPGSYIRMSGSKPSGSAQKKSKGMKGKKDMGNMPGKGSSHMSSKPVGGKKGYTGHSGAMRLGNDE